MCGLPDGRTVLGRCLPRRDWNINLLMFCCHFQMTSFSILSTVFVTWLGPGAFKWNTNCSFVRLAMGQRAGNEIMRKEDGWDGRMRGVKRRVRGSGKVSLYQRFRGVRWSFAVVHRTASTQQRNKQLLWKLSFGWVEGSREAVLFYPNEALGARDGGCSVRKSQNELFNRP